MYFLPSEASAEAVLEGQWLENALLMCYTIWDSKRTLKLELIPAWSLMIAHHFASVIQFKWKKTLDASWLECVSTI